MIRTVLAGLRPTTVPGLRWSSRVTAGALALVAAAGMFSVLATASGLADLLGNGDDTVLLVTLGGLAGLAGMLFGDDGDAGEKTASTYAERVSASDGKPAAVFGTVATDAEKAARAL